MPFGGRLKFAASSGAVEIPGRPFDLGGELNLASAFVDGTNLLAQITARTAASNSASNLEHAAAWLYWLDAAVLQIRRTKKLRQKDAPPAVVFCNLAS
jgi:hypothetical protein